MTSGATEAIMAATSPAFKNMIDKWGIHYQHHVHSVLTILSYTIKRQAAI
jgi:hypothetical protein